MTRLADEDFDAAIAEKDHALRVGDDHKVAKFWEAELDELHANPSLADGGVDTQAAKDAARRADVEFREALTVRVSALLRGCGFTRVRIDSESVEDDETWSETRYVVRALDTERRGWTVEIDPGTRRRRLGVEHTREFLFDLADQIAARLVAARDNYLARMVLSPVREVPICR